jgi:hypothetical protein
MRATALSIVDAIGCSVTVSRPGSVEVHPLGRSKVVRRERELFHQKAHDDRPRGDPPHRSDGG